MTPIHEQLKARRLRLKMTQTEVGAKAGINQTHIARLEKGQINSRVGTVEAVADALGMELSLKPKPNPTYRKVRHNW